MRLITSAILALSAFALFGAAAGPARAGGDGYYAGFSPYAWIARDCCAQAVVPAAPAMPVVPVVPAVRYLRLVEQLPDCAYCDDPPARFGANPYWPPDCTFGGCPGYFVAYSAAPGDCRSRRVRVFNRRSGWAWRVKTICY